MSYVEYLRNQRGVYSAVWLDFIHAYKRGTREVYAFFEGPEDVAFYMPELRRRNSAWGGVRAFACKGKRIVLRLIAVVRKRLDHQWRALFFVDKDVDDMVGANAVPPDDPFVFQTAVYSIENYLVSPASAACVWTDLLQLPDGNAAMLRAVALFGDVHAKAMRALRGISAWAICHRRRGNAPNVNNVNLNKLFEVTRAGAIRKRCPVLPELDRSAGVATSRGMMRSIRRVLRELRGIPEKTHTRGKFELWFFVRAMDIITDGAQPGGRYFAGTAPATAARITTSNAVTLLAAKIPPPAEVTAFLDRAEALAAAA